jgi:hypothetical protein
MVEREPQAAEPTPVIQTVANPTAVHNPTHSGRGTGDAKKDLEIEW